jgi:DNA-binding transcriptional MerR regulator
MPVKIDGQIYYRTNEVCQMSGISRSTLFRWLKEEVINEPAKRDWRGWRLFELPQVEQIKIQTSKSQFQTSDNGKDTYKSSHSQENIDANK